MDGKKTGFSLGFLVSTAIVMSMALLALIIIGNTYQSNRDALINAAQVNAQNVADSIDLKIEAVTGSVVNTLRLLELDPLSRANNYEQRLERLSVLARTLETNDILSAVYVGYADGDFFLLRSLEDPNVREKMNAPQQARYLVQSIERDANGSVEEMVWSFYDQNLHELGQHIPEQYEFDPRQRPWFKQASEANSPIVTSPYIYYTTRDIGITLATENKTTGTIFGVDASISDLSNLLKSLQPSPLSYMVLVEGQERAIAYPRSEKIILADHGQEPRLATINELNIPALSHLLDGPNVHTNIEPFTVNDSTWYGLKAQVGNDFSGKWRLFFTIPSNELLAEADAELAEQLIWSAMTMCIFILLGWVLGSRISRPLIQLSEEVKAIARFDFKYKIHVDSPIKEVRHLSLLIDRLAQGIRGFKSISRTLSRETDPDKLLHQVIDNLGLVTSANSGLVYFYDAEQGILYLPDQEVDGMPQVIACGNGNDNDIVATVEREFGALAEQLMITPLRDKDEELLGLLILSFTDEELTHSGYFKQFVEEVSGSAATAIRVRRQVEEQEKLINSIIRLLADAIDAKSPYTSGHCERVPELAETLLEVIERSGAPEFEGFKLSDKDRREFRIAAWLHDCGKITSPEYIVDKATKLETTHNRIHEIRTRFEVLWRDADVAYWQGLSEGGTPDVLQQQREESQRQLTEEFTFVANANIGGEFMSDEDITRLNEISQREWTRNFDDGIGLSREERERRPQTFEKLPVVERLLADKNHHVISWGKRRPAVERDNPENRWGFDMTLPENRFNLGELHNLSIRKGTLNPEERFAVNDHIVQTIKMLYSLPLPSDLKNVPEIAGNHHERMDGMGYPRRLKARELSIQERVMAIADIFEALTAADRPYKDAKSLSESVRILAFMVKDQHIDGDIFRIFLESGVYLTYASKFLEPEQIDDVDVEATFAIAFGDSKN